MTSPSTFGHSKRRQGVTLIIAAIIVPFFFWFAARTDRKEVQSTGNLAQSDLYITNVETAPVEYQLAYLDSGHLPRGNDLSAARIRYLLKYMEERTGDSQKHVADRTSASTSLLKQKYGRAVTNQRFLEEANAYFKAGGPKTNFDDLSGMLVITLGR